MSRTIWDLEWRVAVRRRRLLAWNVIVPLALLVPVALSPAAAPHRAAVYSVFISFFGLFGSCIPLVGDRSSGWIEKLSLTGYGDRRWLAERIAAGTAVDAAELSPTVLALLLVSESRPAAAAVACMAVLHGLLVANVIGTLVGWIVRSVAEAALACAAVALLALHFSGAFRVANPASWAWYVERVAVFAPLVREMRRLAGGGQVQGVAAGEWIAPLASTAVVVVVALVAAPWLAAPARSGGDP